MLYKPLGRGNDTAQYEEAAHRHDHLHGGIRSGDDADALAAVEDAAAEGAAAQQFPDDADGDQRQRVADALTPADARTPFLEANASARPRTIQFTTISGINTPRLWDSAGRNA